MNGIVTDVCFILWFSLAYTPQHLLCNKRRKSQQRGFWLHFSTVEIHRLDSGRSSIAKFDFPRLCASMSRIVCSIFSHGRRNAAVAYPFPPASSTLVSNTIYPSVHFLAQVRCAGERQHEWTKEQITDPYLLDINRVKISRSEMGGYTQPHVSFFFFW